MTLQIRDQRGAVSLRYRNRAENTVLMCEEKLYLVRFSCRRKNYSVQRRNCLEHYIPRRILEVCPMVLLGSYGLEFCRELRIFLCFFTRNMKKQTKTKTKTPLLVKTAPLFPVKRVKIIVSYKNYLPIPLDILVSKG